jgi:hypothetical protein
VLNFSIHVLESDEDAAQAKSDGVFNFLYEVPECTNCGMIIGLIPNGVFLPCAILVDQDSVSWPVCIDCAAPLIFPGDWLMGYDD